MIRRAFRFVFRGPGEWRAGWRFLAFFVIAFVLVKAAYWCVIRVTGYMEQTGWKRELGFWPAAILLSALFGAAHLSKPHETFLDIANIALLGLFWSFTVRRSGSVWFAVGFHAMSDFADLVLYAAPNTGNGGQPLPGHLLNVTYRGPEWLTGGACGMEASVFSLLIVVAMFALFHRLHPQVRWRPEDVAPVAHARELVSNVTGA